MAVISLGMSQSGAFMPKRIWLTRKGVRPDMMLERVGAQYMKTLRGAGEQSERERPSE